MGGLALGCLMSGTGVAAVIHVDQARPGTGAGDGASWSSALKTVTEAMAVAGAGDEIWVARGTYPERITVKAGVKLYGGFNATETLLSARDWRVNHSILDGQAAGTVVVVESGAGADTRIDGLLVRNGYGGPGGGIQVIGASPVIANNWIQNNAATVAGGGIYLTDGAALVISNRIEGNYVTNYQGQVAAGGGGIISSNASPVIKGNQIVRNSAPYGGGVRCWEGAALIEGNSVMANRSLFLGGGIEVAAASVVIERNRIAGNVVTQGTSGGISVVASPDATIRNNLILANHASYGASDAYADSGSLLRLTGNTFLGNGNNAVGTLHIDGNNFDAANNIVAFGGGVQLSASDSWRHNCVFGNVGANYLGGLPDPTGSNGNISIDPLVGWSRERMEFHLQPDSPCIDAGTLTGLTPGDFDIDGESREFGGGVDIGADEFGGAPMDFAPRIVRVAVSGDDANDGSTWPAAKRTIQAALDDALRDSGEVWVAAGLYQESIDLHPLVKLFGGFTGTEALRGERDVGTNETVIDASGVTNVVRGEYLDAIVELNGFIIQNGRASTGGGIRLRHAPANIVGNRMRANWALPVQSGAFDEPPNAGGGIFTVGSDAHITDNIIEQNVGMLGAALYVRSGRPLIQRNLIMGNVATNLGSAAGASAGIMLAGTGVDVANNNLMANRLFVDGGSRSAATAIWAEQPVRIINNTFFGNTADRVLSHSAAPGAAVGQAAVFLNANGSLIANNVFQDNIQGIRTASHPSQTIVNNCFFRQLGTNFSGLPTPDGSAANLFSDPRLVGPYASLHLAADSPCRNAGDNTHVVAGWKDADGEERILDGVVDIGADEFTGAVPTSPVRMVYVRGDGNDLADGRSWPTAKRTVQAAIDQAFTLGGAEVWVARGNYPELIRVKPFTYLHGGFAGDESSAAGRDLLTNPTVIDARQLGTAVTVDAPGTFSALRGFTIVNGRGFFGGGVYCRPLSAPLIANNRIFNCASVVSAADVSLVAAGLYSGGGGIRGEMASPMIVNNLVVSNTAESITMVGRIYSGAGGIRLSGGSNAVVAHNTLARNSGYPGVGGIGTSTHGVLIWNNIISLGTGGISASTGSNPLIERNCFFGNDSDGLTGAGPLFQNLGFLDDQATFFLATGSPCRDAAVSLPALSDWPDVYGRSRVVGGMADLGAVEMQPDDTIVPITPLPDYTIEVVGGVAYLRYQREVVGDESGALLPSPVWEGNRFLWPFEVSRNLTAGGSLQTYSGTLLLGALPPGSYQFNPVSWGVPLAVTTFTVLVDGAGTITSPLVSGLGFEFTLNGVEHARYVTEHSVNWEPWEAVATNDTANGSVLIPADRLTGRDYFRVRIEGREVMTP